MKPIPAKRWLLPLLPLLILPALTFQLRSKQPRRELPHDAYIWQHRWTPAVTAALEQNSDVIRAWQVLVAELDSGGRWWPTSVNLSALRRSGRSVILVIRIDGSRANWDEQRIQSDIDGLIYDWRRTGFRIAGVEIDHDSGVAGLKVYTRFIAGLRARLDPTVPLSITALPAWLASPDAYRLFAEADEIVLQVHAVQNPHAGLFDRARARDWIDELSRRTRKPFRVALPAYGSRVSWRDDGGLLAVESEAPLLAGVEYRDLARGDPQPALAASYRSDRARQRHARNEQSRAGQYGERGRPIATKRRAAELMQHRRRRQRLYARHPHRRYQAGAFTGWAPAEPLSTDCRMDSLCARGESDSCTAVDWLSQSFASA